ncbi:hypothetical protein FZD47_18100 [Bacillus infantis]|uniref:Uncharacterized protein n=1 Tax=Bacillus infantis TaxID=324767 RepID=A0A5D4SH35_9BACI|nr:hypothetical protein [Bacillus infantis]TYS62001.1 hypothetical protein FZD47_18100 [Bacillus infantis]
MLFKKLEALYNENKTLAKAYPIQEYYPLLQHFISKEVALGSEYLSPYRFALFFSKPTIDAVRFFLGLADSENIVETLYKYECDDCGTINLLKDEDALLNFKCKQCGFKDELVKTEYLSEVKLLFKISDELLDQVKSNLKDNPLSDEFEPLTAKLERGMDEEVSLAVIDNAVYTNEGEPISKKAEKVQEKFSNYRRILRMRD